MRTSTAAVPLEADAAVDAFTVALMGEQQQMARVDVDLETWQTFRIEAIRRGRSIADWLGELVEREVARTQRVAQRQERDGDTDRTGDEQEDPGQRERPTTRPRVLDGQPILTELPHAGSKPPPWEV